MPFEPSSEIEKNFVLNIVRHPIGTDLEFDVQLDAQSVMVIYQREFIDRIVQITDGI